MKIYKGIRTGTVAGGKQVVVIEGDSKRPLTHVIIHSPTGMNWGYGGSGPADLAFSILFNLFERETAEKHYQAFKWDFIASLDPNEGFEFTEPVIRSWLLDRSRRQG